MISRGVKNRFFRQKFLDIKKNKVRYCMAKSMHKYEASSVHWLIYTVLYSRTSCKKKEPYQKAEDMSDHSASGISFPEKSLDCFQNNIKINKILFISVI